MIGDEATALVEAVVENADKLGLKWELRPATVSMVSQASLRVTVVMDGDDSNVTMPAFTLIGQVSVGQRVMVVSVPPQGAYIIGSYGFTHGLVAAKAFGTDVSIGVGVQTVNFEGSDYDTYDMWNGSSQFVLPFDGVYVAHFNVLWLNTANAGIRFASINHDSTTIARDRRQSIVNDNNEASLSNDFLGEAGDVVTFQVLQTGNVSLNLVTVTGAVRYVGTP